MHVIMEQIQLSEDESKVPVWWVFMGSLGAFRVTVNRFV